MSKLKFRGFPNETFKTQNEYFKFCFNQRPYVFGEEAYALKKKQDKRAKLLEPKIRAIQGKLRVTKTQVGLDDDSDTTNMTKRKESTKASIKN